MKKRLDQILLDRKLAADEREARGLILAGKVRVQGELSDKCGSLFHEDVVIDVKKQSHFVGRGAEKLLAPLKEWALDVQGKTCADIGSSTGGFTQVLLEAGASRVYAIDSAFGELDWRLRNDDRVVVMEKTNVLRLESMPEALNLITIDVSLTSVRPVLKKAAPWLAPSGAIIALLKPQYEVASEQLPEGAVIRDTKLHHEILHDFCSWCSQEELIVQGLLASPVKGRSGNQEFLCLLSREGKQLQDVESCIKELCL